MPPPSILPLAAQFMTRIAPGSGRNSNQGKLRFMTYDQTMTQQLLIVL
jgi:hypothetical protein